VGETAKAPLARCYMRVPRLLLVGQGLAVARLLERKVRAVIRELTDTELVIAQGKENTERRDLSFIEKSLFALNLEEAGHDRATIIAALSVDKAEVARYLGVAIGPAPKAGRPRWMELSERLKGKGSTVKRILVDPSFVNADTDVRFSKLFSALSSRDPKGNTSTWSDPQGRPVVKIERTATKTQFTVDEKLAPNFGSYLEEKLGEIYSGFSSRRDDLSGD
jgi:ParB family chromosome partitioning protein